MGDLDGDEAGALEALLVLAFVEDPGTEPPDASGESAKGPSEEGEGGTSARRGGGYEGPERRQAGFRRAA